jgi:hypothetical protein
MRSFILSLVVLATGCAAGAPSSSKGLNTSLGECAPVPCVKVDISVVPKLPESMPAPARGSIESAVRKALYSSLDVESDEHTKESVLRELQERLVEYQGLSDAPINWVLSRSAQVLFSNGDITSVEVLSEGYLGGAHGFNERLLMTFDSKTGSRLGVGDLVDESSQKLLSKIVEAEFRRAREVPGGQSLQDAGFFILPGQEMPLGENFALTDKGLEIQYNPYEVAPYSFGQTRVQVPREAIEPLVRAGLRPIFSARVGAETR